LFEPRHGSTFGYAGSTEQNRRPMSPSRILCFTACLSLGCNGRLAGQPFAPRFADGNEEVVAVSSAASNGYSRLRLPDGSFQAETYAFAKGGKEELVMVDSTMDTVSFMDLVQMLTAALARQNYLPTPDKDPDKTKLLIYVYWGTTFGPKDMIISGAEGGPTPPHLHQVYWNAMILGYNLQKRQMEMGVGDDLLHNRYFVVLMAYDFQLLRKQGEAKLLWNTRFSLRQIGHNFRLNLPAMAQYASRYFGQDTNGLVYKQVPEGRVEVGEPTIVESGPGKK